jgi:hypothetical protein
MLRAFADRMLRKVTAMDDPEDLPGVERAMRVAAVIERVYSRCDRAERQTRVEAPDLFKAEADCATHKTAAIKARVSLANTLRWGEERRRDLGHWWDAAQTVTQTPPETSSALASKAVPAGGLKITPVDNTDAIEAARAELALRRRLPLPSPPAQKPPLPV